MSAGEKERAGRIMNIAFDPQDDVPTRERRIAAEIRAAAASARKAALEEAAELAVAQVKPLGSDWRAGYNNAAQNIATDLRALAAQPETGKGE